MHAYTLLDLLSDDERIIVLSSRATGTIYTWNGSLTLQCWTDLGNGQWEECGIRTLSKQPASVKSARRAAQEWHYSSEEA